MSPVSTEPSLSTTRCVIESLFLKLTICPPNVAGFGENACVPFCPLMAMVVVLVVFPPPDGEVGVELPYPPPPQVMHASPARDASAHTWNRIVSSSHPAREGKVQGEGQLK